MLNTIDEADNACFWYQHFYPTLTTIISMNDGDAFPISLLQSRERHDGDVPRNRQYLCLPYRKKQKKDNPLAITHRFEYVDVNALYAAVRTHAPFVEHRICNPVATLTFLIILCNTDFFANFAPGIGYATKWCEGKKQTPGILDTFKSQIATFSHLVQWHYDAQPPDPCAERRIVLDERLFELFTYHCYFNKHGDRAKRSLSKSDLSITDLRVYCSKFKKESHRLPDKSAVRLWARQLTWNMQYWLNAPRNIYVDPYETYMGKSYYGYVKGPNDIDITTDTSPKQKEVDEAYKRNFYKRRQKKKKRKKVAPPSAIDKIRKLSEL